MENSFLDYLADSPEEAQGPIPRRRKRVSAPPRGNAQPGIAATARSVTRAADRLEKDHTQPPPPRPGIFDSGAQGPVFGSDLAGQVDAMVREQERAPDTLHLRPPARPDAATWVQPKTSPAQSYVGPFQGTEEDYQRGGERFEEAVRRRAEFARQSPQMRVAERFAGGAVDGMFMGRTHQLEGLLDPTRTTADYDQLDAAIPKATTDGEARGQLLGELAGSALPFVAGAGALRAAGSRLPEAALAHLAETGRAGRMALAAGENAGFGSLRRGAGDDPEFLRHMGMNAAIGAGFGALTSAPEAPVTEAAARRAAAIAPPELAPAARDLLGVVREGGNPQGPLDIQRPNWMDFGTRANLGDLLTPNAGRAAAAGLANVVRQVSERRRAARGTGFNARIDDALGVTTPREASGTQTIRPETNVFGVEPGTATLPRSEGPTYGVSASARPSRSLVDRLVSPVRNETGATGFRAERPSPQTPSDEGYLYHATNLERAREIAGGELRPHEPWDFTDQDAWPDGATEPRSYFSPRADMVHHFAPDEGEPVVLRARRDAAPFRSERHTGDIYSNQPVRAGDLEIMGEGNLWVPLAQAMGRGAGDTGASSLRPPTALAGAGLGAAGGAVTRAMRAHDVPGKMRPLPPEVPDAGAYADGAKAAHYGLSLDTNRYREGSQEWRDFNRGWKSRQPAGMGASASDAGLARDVNPYAEGSPEAQDFDRRWQGRQLRRQRGTRPAVAEEDAPAAARRFVAMPAERGRWRVIDSANGSVAEEVGGIGAQRTAEALAKRYDVERGVVAGADAGPLAGSRVVDETGAPKVVYHGTSRGFEEFDPARLDADAQYGPGYYFTENPAVAGGEGELGGYAKSTTARAPAASRGELADYFTPGRVTEAYGRPERVVEFSDALWPDWTAELQPLDAAGNPAGARRSTSITPADVHEQVAPNVRPARLGIRNPFDIDATYSPEEVMRIVRVGGAAPETVSAIESSLPGTSREGRIHGEDVWRRVLSAWTHAGDPVAVNETLRKAGYDGITHIGGGNTGTDPHRVWIAFDRPQIRSAFGPAESAAQTGSTSLAMMRATGGAGAGGLYGYATGDADDEVSRTARALAFAAAGAGVGFAPEALSSMRRAAGNDAGVFNPHGQGLERFNDGDLRALSRMYDGNPAQQAILREIAERDAAISTHSSAADAVLSGADERMGITHRVAELPRGYTIRQDGALYVVRDPAGRIVAANQNPHSAVGDALLRSMRRVSGNDAGALGDVGGMADPERALYDALTKRGRQPAPRDLSALASGEMEPADFARAYGVSRRVAKNYQEHVRTLADPEGYRSPLDSDEFAHDRPERESFAYQPPPEAPPVEGVPDDSFLPSDASPNRFGSGNGQIGMNLLRTGAGKRLGGALGGAAGGAAFGAVMDEDDRVRGALKYGAIGATVGTMNPEAVPVVRRAEMLINVAGRARDLFDNVAVMAPMETASSAIATLADMMPGQPGGRTLAFSARGTLRAARIAATEGVADMGRAIVGKPGLSRASRTASEAASASVEHADRVAMGNPILDALVRLPGRFAGSIDRPAAVYAYERSMANQAKVIALRERLAGTLPDGVSFAERRAQLLKAPTSEMEALAASEVAHATFTNKSTAGRMLEGMRNATYGVPKLGLPDLPAARVAIDINNPFRRVPGASVGKVAEYSPLGLGKVLHDSFTLHALAKAGSDPALIAAARRSRNMTVGRVATGATSIAAGISLASQGLMTGIHVPQNLKNDGAGPMSIKFAGRWWPLWMVPPAGPLMGVGAEVYHHGTADAARGLGQNLAEGTFLRGTRDVDKALSSEDGGESYGERLASSFVPPIVGQVAHVVDPVARKPEGQWQAVEARIPFASRNVPARTDNFGGEVRETASLPGRVALALFDGVHSVPSRGGKDAVQDRLTRMGVNVGTVRRKTAETEQEFAERISNYPEAPHREDETDADYQRRAATWDRQRPAETDAQFRQRQRQLGASIHSNLSALFARKAPEDEYLNDKWEDYRAAEATAREKFPRLRGPAFQRAVEKERRRVVASLIAGTKHSFAVAGDEDPRTYLSP